MDKKITLTDIMRVTGLLGMPVKPRLSKEVCKMIVNGYMKINGIDKLNDDEKTKIELNVFVSEYGILYGIEK